MPAVTIDPDLPTLYLDWSHLSDACCSSIVSDSPWKPLADVLISKTANVCVSSVHLLELLAWPDHQRAECVAAAMDELPLVWMESAAELIEITEAKRALLRALGANIEPYRPFRRGFVQLFERGLKPAGAAEMLADSTVSACLRDNRDRDMRPLRAISLVQARDFARDRKRAELEGYDDEEMMRGVASAAPHAASTMLERACLALRQEDGFRNARIDRPSDVEIQQAIRAVIADPTALPAFRVTAAVLNAFALRIRQQDPGSQRFAQHQSSWLDMMHCGAGAAYCDVFTCDARTAQDLDDTRTSLGRQPALTERGAGGPHELVRAIESQLLAASTHD